MSRIQQAELAFGSMEDMDGGRLASLFKKHLATVSYDCMNRPRDKAKRKIIIELSFEPVPDRDDPTICRSVKQTFKIRSKTPDYVSEEFEMQPHKSGFIFNRDFPDSLNQPSLYPRDEE